MYGLFDDMHDLQKALKAARKELHTLYKLAVKHFGKDTPAAQSLLKRIVSIEQNIVDAHISWGTGDVKSGADGKPIRPKWDER